jgi:hypothetical protein
MQNYTTPSEILERLGKWEETQRALRPMTEDEAEAKLTRKGVTSDELEAKQASVTHGGKPAGKCPFADYKVLQGIDRLAEAHKGIDLSGNPNAATVQAVLQAAEIAILNTSDLTRRVTKDIEGGKLGDAEEKYRWISSLQQTLLSLSGLAAKLPAAGKGYQTSIADSPHIGACLDDLKALHGAINKAGLTEAEHISAHDIHESGRNISHQAFVDATYTDLWRNGLQTVNIPDMQLQNREDARAFYKRFVGTDALNLAVNELDQTGDNFLRQFRAYHQMSEILVKQANMLIADSIKIILSPDGNILQAKENMDTALNMLDIMNQNLAPILRNLSVNKYQEIRGSLGVTSGSDSPNIKDSLFDPLYALYVAAVKSRVMGMQPYDKGSLAQKLQDVVANQKKDHATHDQYDLLCQANRLHGAIRGWRELHMQFIKTQIGLAPEGDEQTASISGSQSAMRSIHAMLEGAHGKNDPIIPIYEELTGKDFSPVTPFQITFREGIPPESFVGKILKETADVVKDRSSSVQARVKKGGGGCPFHPS